MSENTKPKLKLYNTLTRSKEDFIPIDENKVRMYVCGPTVYDFAHIGNARPVIVFDVLNRLLRHLYGDEHVTYVRNITDVDDKINARALRDFPNLPLNEAIRNVTEKTANQFHADVKALGCLEPDHEPRATEHIDGMIEMIQKLIDKGHAYLATGEGGHEVLFDVRKMPSYGALSNRKLDDQQSGARVSVKDHKRNPGDFVLWKQSSENEPGWEASFTENGKTTDVRGRPGWHIECSVMSKHHLSEVFDIHGGGLDLIFPHHENEIAQSCCAHDTDVMANVWMHNGYLQVEGKKMSKSEGNFVTIHDLLHTEKFGGRKWPGEVLRLAMLMTHYREPIDFSVKRLEEAANQLYDMHLACFEAPAQMIPADLIENLSNDLNFSAALPELHSIRNRIAHAPNGSEKVKAAGDLRAAIEFLGLYYEGNSADLFGFVVKDYPSAFEVDPKIAERLAFIADKNWAEADRIRDELLSQGIQLKDSKDSETGERKTTWEVKR